MGKKRRHVRADFRKGHQTSRRDGDLTRSFELHGDETDHSRGERVSGKGRLTRRRTLAGAEVVDDATGQVVLPAVDQKACVFGRVLRVQGLVSRVLGVDGRLYACATRQRLKQLASELRHVVAAGDRVWVRPEGTVPPGSGIREGFIERVEPRHGVLSRTSRGRQQLIAANVDQVVIVASVAEPRLKPHLVDRYLVTAERTGLEPIVCLNKIDLVDPADLVPVVGVWAQLGYEVLAVSASTGFGVDRLRSRLVGKETAFAGQSGVGKSSLLNAVEPGLALRVQTVSAESEKGRHTTTTAELYPWGAGADSGFLVDTPGIRSFELWDVVPEEVASYFPELRPYVSRCRFPDCTHTHEDFCEVKDAVADGWIDARRYESYLQMRSED